MAEKAPSQRIRLAVVSEPGKAGVKTHVVDLLRGLDVERFDVTFYYSLRRTDADYPVEIREIAARGVNCVEIPLDGSLKPKDDLRALRVLLGNLRRQRPQILHLHSSKAGGVGRLASMLMWPRPWVVYTPHAMACYRSKFYLWLERVLGLVTHVPMSVSASEKQDFVKWRIPKAKSTRVLTMGVRPPLQQAQRERNGTGTWCVGACGRICYQKNAKLFFELALRLRREGKFRFRWIGDFGDDEEANEVRTMLEQAGNPPEIEITGWVSNPQEHLQTLDTFCMFSRDESFGYVTAEAMALGVPVVATACTGTIDLVQNGVTGLLVDANVPSLEAAVRQLASDPPLCEKLAENGRRLITEKYTVARMVDEVQQLYTELAGNGKLSS